MVSNEYTAGFLDADGSVSLEKQGDKRKQWSRIPSVSFYNCDRGILEAINATHYGGRISEQKGKKANHNTSYTLKFKGHPALYLLECIMPYMLHSKKAKRAKFIVEGYERLTPRNGKYTEEQIKEKLILVEQVMGITMRGPGAY